MEYFKKADPNDMSQGDLSRRINFLKCDERGIEEMCEVSARIYDEGKQDGRLEGILEGKIEGEKMLADLINHLLEERRYTDIERVTVDQSYREQLC